MIFETFVTSISLLSRGMVFNAFAILFGIYKFSKKVKKPNNTIYYLKLISLILFLFYISVSIVNQIRSKYFLRW